MEPSQIQPLGKTAINGATSQHDRGLQALAAEYAKVEGRSFFELLDFAVEFASLIQFYDYEDERQGNWVDFYLVDPTVISASMEATGLAKAETAFQDLERQAVEACQFGCKFSLFREMFKVILELARRVNAWLDGLRRLPESVIVQPLLYDITEAIESGLREQLHKLKSYDLGAGLKSTLRRPIGLEYHGFLPIWQLDDVEPDGSIYHDWGSKQPYHDRRNRMIDHALTRLNPILNSFAFAISDWCTGARTNLPQTLDSGNHKPQVALFIAFAKLFHTAQESVNTFSQRYLRFYYDDVLRGRHRGPVADNVYLTFTLTDNPDVTRTTVPVKTRFSAGQDADDNEILYGFDRDLVVTQAAIGQVRTLRVDRGPLFYKPRTGYKHQHVVRRILSSVPPIHEQDAAADVGHNEQQDTWPIFGPTTRDPLKNNSPAPNTEVEVSAPATLGFAIASQYLLLMGGERRVELEVSFNHSLDGLLDELRETTGLNESEILSRVLDEAFDIFVSTSGGWFPVESYTVTVSSHAEKDSESETPGGSHGTTHQFTLKFTLPPSAPPVVAFHPEGDAAGEQDDISELLNDDIAVQASNPAPDLPTLKAYLRQTSVYLNGSNGAVNIYRISLIDEIQIDYLRIGTHVQQLAHLALTNTDGEVDTSAPFMPFGGLPVVGSFLQIRSDELFSKTLESLSIHTDWFNLPQNEHGFAGYYRDYVINLNGTKEPPGSLFNNQSFRGRISVLDPGTWELMGRVNDAETADDLGEYLFRTQNDCDGWKPEEGEALCSKTTFDFKHPRIHDHSKPAYYSPAQSAIQLELTAPPYAFGNDLYPQNVLNAVIENLPNVDACSEACCAICQVLTDTVASVEACLHDCLARGTQLTGPISQWQMIGAWDKSADGEPEFNVSQAPDLKAQVQLSQGRVIRWQQVTSQDKHGKLSLPSSFKPYERAWAMAYAAINVEKTGSVDWHIGSDDQAIVWVNGVKIYEFQGIRRWEPNQAHGRVELHEGVNHIWFQTGNARRLWEFSMAVDTPLQKCLENGLGILKKQLRQASIKGFLDCVVKCLRKLYPHEQSDLRELEGRLEQAAGVSADEASRTVQQFLHESREPIGEDAASCIRECWQNAVRIWKAADRVGVCQKGVSDCGVDDRVCMISSVELCVADLRESYQDCLKACIDDCMQPKPILKYPNEPYLPRFEKLTVDYTATCTIPATGSRQSCQEQCEVLEQAARLIKEAVRHCQNVMGAAYEDCIEQSIAQCLRRLLKLFLDCLAQCYRPGSGQEVADTYTRIEKRIQSWQELSPVEQSRDIQPLADECRVWLSGEGASFQSDCLNQCLELLGAILCVESRMSACRTEMHKGYKHCTEAGLAGCQEQLERAYARCLTECRRRRCLTKCGFLSAAAEHIQQCLNHCQDESGRAYFDCMSQSIKACQKQLLEDAIKCFRICCLGCGKQLPEKATGPIQAALEMQSEASYAQRSRQLIELLDESPAVIGEDNAPHLCDCWASCLHVLQAILCLEDRESECQQQIYAAYKQCIETDLTHCQEQLECAFERCVSECRQRGWSELDEEQHHQQCREYCQILAEAADWVKHCRDHCQDRTGQRYVQCIEHGVMRCVKRLFHANLECLRRCLKENKSKLSPEAIRTIESYLDVEEDSEASEVVYGQRLKQNLDECWQKLPAEDLQCLQDCRVKCLELLKAALCLEESLIRCRDKMYKSYKPCIETGLAGCKQRLEQQYRECLRGCHHHEQAELQAGVDCSPQCRDECRVLDEAAQWIKHCRQHCHDRSGKQYFQCIEHGVLKCQERLLAASLKCFAKCLTRCASTLSSDARERILACLQANENDPCAEQANQIKRRLKKCLQVLQPAETDCLAACTVNCWELLEAVLCLEACLRGCRENMYRTFKRCTTNSLIQCAKQVQRAYVECVRNCMAQKPKPDEPCALFFHLLPFGGYEPVEWTEKTVALLPKFENEGILNIGFTGLLPPQPLTLLFRMASHAAPGASVKMPTVQWEYLTHNRWQPLETSQVPADTTNGLQNSGVVALRLPKYDPQNNTVMSPVTQPDDETAIDLQWLRAVVKDKPNLFPKATAIDPHAALATWRDVDSTGEHLRQPLPPYTINSSVEDLPDIAQINQPMESFGGRPAETPRSFETRFGERLRHKDRANLAWDYERLVLERFPTIWKAQTLPARDSKLGDQPGKVLVVVVPGPDSIQAQDPTAPLASGELLDQIQSYLSSLASPFVQLQVVNPNYVRIEVTATVRFRLDQDQGVCIDQLNDELVKYLSPWFYDAARAAKRGHYASQADICEFIQTRPYVDSMISIAFEYQPKPATLDWYFLTSAKKHQIVDADEIHPITSNKV